MEKLYLGEISKGFRIDEEMIKKHNIKVGTISPFSRKIVISEATEIHEEPDIVEVVAETNTGNDVDIIEVSDGNNDVDIIELNSNGDEDDIDIVEVL